MNPGNSGLKNDEAVKDLTSTLFLSRKDVVIIAVLNPCEMGM